MALAYMWYDLASAATKSLLVTRDNLRRFMTSKELPEAHRFTHEWIQNETGEFKREQNTPLMFMSP
jgi:hypothetical protein